MASRAKRKTSKIRFIEVPTPALVKLESDDGTARYDGSFVKFCPRLRRSERAAFDAGKAIASLLERGASVVVAAPTTIPDAVVAKQSKERAERIDPRNAVVTWFYESAVPESPGSLAAIDGCFAILDEVGL